LRALIIDDSRAMRTILSRIVSSLGFEISQAGDGKQGLAVDWNMPEMNGYDFVRAVRANAAYADIKVMMVTTESEIANMTKAMEAGANEYVMKPFTNDVVLDKLRILGLAGND
jgi:two-component system, chemotaxis family, chemotaxis protein CheY